MKTRFYIFILLFSLTANAQELVINSTVYGQVTTTLYKEARIVRPITPAQFHELSVLHSGYRFNFKHEDDYSSCFSSYPKTIDWELTEEELRNLRNFIRRNGGSLPKTLNRMSSSFNRENTNELVSTIEDIEAKEEDEDNDELPVPITELSQEIDTNISISTGKESTTWTSIPNDLDSSQISEIANSYGTSDSSFESNTNTIESKASIQKIDQMRALGRKGVIYRNDTLSVRKAKLIAMNQNFTAYRHFTAAQRIRGWNTLLGIATLPIAPVVIVTGPVIVVRESIRKRRIEKAVEAYNISILRKNNGDIKTLVR
jgi:hypothetical protein